MELIIVYKLKWKGFWVSFLKRKWVTVSAGKVFQIGRAGQVTKHPPTVWSHREWTRDYCIPDCRKPGSSGGPWIPPARVSLGTVSSHVPGSEQLSWVMAGRAWWLRKKQVLHMGGWFRGWCYSHWVNAKAVCKQEVGDTVWLQDLLSKSSDIQGVCGSLSVLSTGWVAFSCSWAQHFQKGKIREAFLRCLSVEFEILRVQVSFDDGISTLGRHF